jgi:uncharacterized OB-fold protein
VLVKLDGADTAMAHVVKDRVEAIRVGARRGGVEIRRGAHRIDPRHRLLPLGRLMDEPPKEPIKYVDATLHLPYHYVAGDSRARYLLALKDRKISARSARRRARSSCRRWSPRRRASRRASSSVADRGVVTTFCIVRIPVIGRSIEIPYVAASVALDGADVSIYALIQECAPHEVRMGMRVEAVWKPDGERQGDHEDIRYFRPTGEPDAPLESFINRL